MTALSMLVLGCQLSVPAIEQPCAPDGSCADGLRCEDGVCVPVLPFVDGGPIDDSRSDQRVDGDTSDQRVDASPVPVPVVTQVGDSAALRIQWSGGGDGWVALERSAPGCGDVCILEVFRSPTPVSSWTDETVGFDVPYRYRVANAEGVGGYSEPVTPRRTTPSVTFSSTPVFADEFDDAELWGTGETSTSGHWRSFAGSDDGRWLEGYHDPALARLVDRPGGVRALALESQPLLRTGSAASWCRWALSKVMLGTPERVDALHRCRVHTAYLRTYHGWQGGQQQGPKFGPGHRFQARVSFAEAIRPGQRWAFSLLVEKPAGLYDPKETEREAAGAGGVAFDGLAGNGAQIDIAAFQGHHTWTTPSAVLGEVSRLYAGIEYDRRDPFDPQTNPNGRSGPGAVERQVDTLNQEVVAGTLSHLGALHGNGPAATFDLRSGWFIFTLEWVKLGAGKSRLDFYVQPDNGVAGQVRYKYLVIADYQTHDTSSDHFLVLGNQVDGALTDFADSVWRDIEQAPNSSGHNTSTSTTEVITAEGEYPFEVYPADRLLVDWVRVYAQQ